MRALLLLLVLGCGSSSREAAPERATPTIGSAAGSAAPAPSPAPAPAKTTVRVDRRVELMSIVMRLAGADEYLRNPKTPYVIGLDAHFAKLADHPAIAATRALRAKHGIAYDAPIHLAMHLDDELAPRGLDELVALDKRWRGVDVAAYAAKLRDFAKAGELDAFLAQRRDYIARVEQALQQLVDKAGAVAWFDDFFGPRTNTTFTVIPGLATGHQNFGSRSTANGTTELVQVLGIASRNGMPPVNDETLALLVHETAHSYVNPLLERHHGKLAAAGRRIFPLVERRLRAQAYASWQTMLNEAGVRAVTTLYLRDRRGDEAGARAARAEQRRGFVWINELVEVLRRCRRDHRGDVEACMPGVIALYDRLAVQYRDGLPKLPFLGPIDAIFEDPVFVVPDGALATYVRRLRDLKFAKAPVVAPAKTTYKDHAERNLVAYGSPATNPIVENVLAHAKITVSRDAIVLGTRRFTGPGLVLVFARFRWDAPSRGVVVYTAARDADLVGLNHGLRHGQTDWVVARRTAKGFEQLASGDFPRAADGAWLLP